MKTQLKFIYLLVITSFAIVSCSEDNPLFQEQEQTYSLDDLQGDWIRTGGNNPANNGLKINILNDIGKITDAVQSGFMVGDIKWKDIVGQSSTSYNHKELGSDYNYYTGTIDFSVDDTLRVNVFAAGAGNIQKWVREANYTPQSVFLEVLQGEWIRVGGNNPNNEGMTIAVIDDEGKVLDPVASGFLVDDIKWKDIYALDGNSFIYEELGSDDNYYPAEMELGVADTLRIDVNNSGDGNIQKWVRQ